MLRLSAFSDLWSCKGPKEKYLCLICLVYFKMRRKRNAVTRMFDTQGHPHPLLLHYLLCFSLHLLCCLTLTASMDACLRCSHNRVLCDLWRKTTFCFGYTNKSVSGFPRERINLIILGTCYACSRAILVIQSHNSDLWKMNRGYCQEASLFSDKVVRNYFN